MKKAFLFGFALFGLTQLTAFSENQRRSEVLVQDFFGKIQGTYVIHSSGGHTPKEDNKIATVSLEGNEGLMIFPYCQASGGVCDPGFRSFPFETTQIYQQSSDSDKQIFTIQVSDTHQIRNFVWEEKGKTIRFKDLDYTLISGETFPLEFIAEKDFSQP